MTLGYRGANHVKRHDFPGFDAGFLFRPFRGVVADKILQLGQTMHPAVDIGGIIESLL